MPPTLRTSAFWVAAGAFLWAACGEADPPRNDRFGSGGAGGAAQAVTAQQQSSSTVSFAQSSSSDASSSSSSSASSSVSSTVSSGAGGGCSNDQAEPNNNETAPTELGTTSDCDNPQLVAGVLPSGDEDWFHYTGTDNVVCDTDPTREIQASGTVRVCKFLEGGTDCDDLTFTCPEGTSDATSPLGLPGCCSDSGFSLNPGCGAIPGFAEIEVYMRIDPAPTETCVTYSLTHHY